MAINFTMNESSSTTGVNDLNEYCLRHIFSYLDMKSQCQVYQTNEYFQNLMASQWRIKYFTKFNFRQEKDLKQLNNDAVLDVIKEVGKQTKKLLYIPTRFINLLQNDSMEIFPNVEILSVRYTREDMDHCTKLQLKQLPQICPNLVNLELVWLQLRHFDRNLFGSMQNLTILTLIPAIGNVICKMELIRSVAFCTTLQYLRISVTLISLSCNEIAKMKSLRMLQLYQVPPENAIMEVTVENFLMAARFTKRVISSIYIKSDLDRYSILAFLDEQKRDEKIRISTVNTNEAKKKLFILRKFSWEPRVRLLRDQRHTLRWKIIHPQVKEFVKTFLQKSHDLEIIDLTNNTHFDDQEIAQLQRQTPNAKILRDKRYEILPFSFEQLRPDEESITFEFL